MSFIGMKIIKRIDVYQVGLRFSTLMNVIPYFVSLFAALIAASHKLTHVAYIIN